MPKSSEMDWIFMRIGSFSQLFCSSIREIREVGNETKRINAGRKSETSFSRGNRLVMMKKKGNEYSCKEEESDDFVDDIHCDGPWIVHQYKERIKRMDS